MEKYKELYLLALEVYKEQNMRYSALSEKASKFLTVLTLIIGVYGYFSKWIYEKLVPPGTFYEWLIIFLSVLLFITLSITWILIVKVMRIEDLVALPLNNEVLDFYKDNEIIDIYYTMSKGIKEAVEANNITIDEKYKDLSKVYTILFIDGIIFILLLLVIVIVEWNFNNLL